MNAGLFLLSPWLLRLQERRSSRLDSGSALRWYRRWWHVLDLLDEKLPLIYELLVLGPVLEEVRQECQELVPVHQQDLLNRHRLVRVCHEDLEHMESLVLNHFPVIAEKVHANLEMLTSVDIGRHDAVV
jgi:hypothetical protein